MKITFLNIVQVKLILITLLFCGLSVFSSPNLQAQTTIDSDFYTIPQGNFVNANTAISRLEADLLSMKIALGNLIPGSQQFKEMEIKYAYYDNIRSILADGKTFDSAAVASAIAGGLSIFTTDIYDNSSKTLKFQLKQSAITRLQL